jgi:hypothetical protein
MLEFPIKKNQRYYLEFLASILSLCKAKRGTGSQNTHKFVDMLISVTQQMHLPDSHTSVPVPCFSDGQQSSHGEAKGQCTLCKEE